VTCDDGADADIIIIIPVLEMEVFFFFFLSGKCNVPCSFLGIDCGLGDGMLGFEMLW